PALAQLFADSGHTATHVMNVGLRDADDLDIWRAAERSAAIIVTKDEDFAMRRLITTAGPAVVWLRVGNCSNRALAEWLTPLLPVLVDRLARGETLIEVI